MAEKLTRPSQVHAVYSPAMTPILTLDVPASASITPAGAFLNRIVRHDVAVDRARGEFDRWCTDRELREQALRRQMQELRSAVSTVLFRTGKPK